VLQHQSFFFSETTWDEWNVATCYVRLIFFASGERYGIDICMSECRA
jgi:hypothetical protein